MVIKRLIIVLLLIASSALAQSADQQSYCAAQVETAKSQADILRTPQATVGLTQSPLVGAPAQLIAGFTSSVQSIRKSHQVGQVADSACKLYSAQENLLIAVQYLVPSMEQSALRNRIQLDESAIAAIDQILQTDQIKFELHNLSRQAMYSLETNRARLVQDHAANEAQLAALIVPVQPSGSLPELIEQAQQAVFLNQEKATELAKTQNFDVQLLVGVRHSAFPLNKDDVGGYGGFSATWSPASRSSNQHLDNAERASITWSNTQVNGPIQMARVLEQQLQAQLVAQHVRLAGLTHQQEQIDQNRDAVVNVDSSASNLFRTTLDADAILLRVEIADTQYRITQLEQK